ncbi:MAG: demethoxyubiquinone hydroxylase family protein [Rhodospirillales bacterium]|nr:demethoxyubiquinone hydroxylase family protein [Rhodospirillales bacterium]
MNKIKSRLGRLPGDPPKERMIESMIRVDQAGEYGAKRIYAGQLAVLGESDDGPLLREMAETEDRHLEKFNQMMVARGVRPTILQPLWYVAGFALGAGSALLGREAAMACTVAVEEVIEEHYRDQSAQLGEDEGELKSTIDEFRAEEIAHKESALEAGATAAPAYPVISAAVKTGSRLAIWLSERI